MCFFLFFDLLINISQVNRQYILCNTIIYYLVVGFSAMLTVIPVRYGAMNAHLCGITAGVIFLVFCCLLISLLKVCLHLLALSFIFNRQ